MEKLLNDIDLLDFFTLEQSLSFVTGTFVLWKDKLHLDPELANSDLLRNFSYAIPDSPLNDDLKFNKADSLTCQIEQYGGGLNGGGVRCGNINGKQLKGIGKNCLARKNVNLWHSYGGFSAVEAAIEVLMTNVANTLLPFGAVNITCVLMLGNTTALHPTGDKHKRGPGVILVRDISVRPAHFIPPRNYEPLDEAYLLVQGLEQKINDASNCLRNRSDLNTRKQSLLLLAERFGAQFATAKIFRLFHGALNASNIALDGRWLDLTTASFVDSNNNYHNGGGFACFYKEHLEAIKILDLILRIHIQNEVHNFRSDLITRYHKSFHESLILNVQVVFGIPKEFHLEPEIKSYLLNSYLEIILNEDLQLEKNSHLKADGSNDRLFSFISDFYSSQGYFFDYIVTHCNNGVNVSYQLLIFFLNSLKLILSQRVLSRTRLEHYYSDLYAPEEIFNDVESLFSILSNALKYNISHSGDLLILSYMKSKVVFSFETFNFYFQDEIGARSYSYDIKFRQQIDSLIAFLPLSSYFERATRVIERILHEVESEPAVTGNSI